MNRARTGRRFVGVPTMVLWGWAVSGGPAEAAAQWVFPPTYAAAGAYAVTARSNLSVFELAAAWAPTLWFSDHEPLLDGPVSLPHPLPTDPIQAPDGQGVVYYRASVVVPKDFPGVLSHWGIQTSPTLPSAISADPVGCPPSPADPQPDCLHLEEVALVRLQYFLYFDEDVGGGGHPHDLEIAEFWFEVAEAPLTFVPPNAVAPHYIVRLDRIIGYAHGHKGFANKLRFEDGGSTDPLVLPLVLLIERGKHAPAADRTGDGHFTPGFDVNRMVSDAWGIRDVFGSSWLGSRTYGSWMTLGRDDRRRALYHPPGYSAPSGQPTEWTYELRDFREAATHSPPPTDLEIYYEHHDYQAVPQDGPPRFFTFFETFGVGVRIDLGLAPYLSWMAPDIPLIGGHPVLSGALGLTYSGNGAWGSLGAYYTPSIAGFFSPYGGLTWVGCGTCQRGAGFGPEAGFKLRIPIPRPPAPSFIGVRVGLRYPSFQFLGGARFLFEVGLSTP